MPPLITRLATGLALLNFQGITASARNLLVTTIDGDILAIDPSGSIARLVNVSGYGIPAGITQLNGTIAVVVSAQETGHFLLRISPSGAIELFADFSDLAGDFGAPFGITARRSYYSYYFVAVSTDVVASGGVVVRVTEQGKVTVIAELPATPFDIAALADSLVVTREDGYISLVGFNGSVTDLVDVNGRDLGSPLGITDDGDRALVTTGKGWIIAVNPDGSVIPVVNIAPMDFGLPTSITARGGQIFVATNEGNILQIQGNGKERV